MATDNKFEEKNFLLNDKDDLITIREEARDLSKKIGFSEKNTVLINTALYELCENVLEYAGEGEVDIKLGENKITFVVKDSGPGIPNPSEVIKVGYSTEDKMGIGLPTAKRIMDGFKIQSVLNKGTTVTAHKQLEN